MHTVRYVMLSRDVNLQDEMVALQRINSYSFLLGIPGISRRPGSWTPIYSLLHRSAVKAANDGIKSVLMVLSPHYNLAR